MLAGMCVKLIEVAEPRNELSIKRYYIYTVCVPVANKAPMLYLFPGMD